ncbi:sugar phosphate isomerase/epimerase family protein [Atlantibacter hermannii]|uniref:sugar phosphate isomerase/epimerase family protein n=1 Tax=Atlantibacter hermannii TaxID=565 RepID=UPI0028ABDF4F|nr:sugar phosphate isomerase/epimerase [Atlantibacter hermannii]
MKNAIIVVTAAYGNSRVTELGGQQALLPIITAAGADGVEIRRELLSEQELNALPTFAAAIASHHLKACYSAPQALFTDSGALNPDLPALLEEAKTLNAHWLKVSLGNFQSNHAAEPLRALLADSSVALVVENDQTRYGKLAPMQRFQAAVSVTNLPVTLTFDMANWLWVGESPELAASKLAPLVSYIHVKAAEARHDRFHAVALDQAEPRWLEMLRQLPGDAPRGIEFPLEGDDLTAVTRHYVNLLREV